MVGYRKILVVISFLLAISAGVWAGQDAAGDKTVVAVAPAKRSPELTPPQLLPGALAGFKATGPVTERQPDQFAEVYREYGVVRAASRLYTRGRVEVFQTENQFGAFGLSSWLAATSIGERVFWKENYCVRVIDSIPEPTVASARMAEAVAKLIPAKSAVETPPLLEKLPDGPKIGGTELYFTGPAALAQFVEQGREMFGFAGDAEAVMAEYQQAGGAVKLVIVEYHTPQFATEALERVTNYVNALPEDQRQRILLKREGNYIVEALNVADREAANQLVEAVKYDYAVKWLREPPTDISEAERARQVAQVILSSFGIIGLTMAVALLVGGIFGTIIFMKRRREQINMFSDAGNMLRLELDPMEAVILGLPPAPEGKE
ncbi:MAG TPA: DUF6599 family protein [Blastocatellia bacterium]|nr:DUF6599 family protein [Blastocatellia bacterium]